MKTLRQTQILSSLLYAGAGYFSAVALVHSLGLKVPGLFVYFNVPSYVYQDRIISFLAFGWAVFFFMAARKPERDLVRAILLLGFVALVALTVNTLLTDFKQFDEAIQPSHFFLILLALFVYWLALIVFSREYIKQPKPD